MGQVREDPKHIQPRVGCTRRSVLDLPVPSCHCSVVGTHFGPQGLGHSLALADASGLQAVELWLGRWCNWVLGAEI